MKAGVFVGKFMSSCIKLNRSLLDGLPRLTRNGRSNPSIMLSNERENNSPGEAGDAALGCLDNCRFIQEGLTDFAEGLRVTVLR